VLALIMVLLSSAIGVASLVDFAKANPLYLYWYPSEPVTTPPIITLQSPSQNQNYNSTDIWLNFTVSKQKHGLAKPNSVSHTCLAPTWLSAG
jgi:hypothetical protein